MNKSTPNFNFNMLFWTWSDLSHFGWAWKLHHSDYQCVFPFIGINHLKYSVSTACCISWGWYIWPLYWSIFCYNEYTFSTITPHSTADKPFKLFWNDATQSQNYSICSPSTYHSLKAISLRNLLMPRIFSCRLLIIFHMHLFDEIFFLPWHKLHLHLFNPAQSLARISLQF